MSAKAIRSNLRSRHLHRWIDRHAGIERLLILAPDNDIAPPAHTNLALAGGSVTVSDPPTSGVTTPEALTILICIT